MAMMMMMRSAVNMLPTCLDLIWTYLNNIHNWSIRSSLIMLSCRWWLQHVTMLAVSHKCVCVIQTWMFSAGSWRQNSTCAALLCHVSACLTLSTTLLWIYSPLCVERLSYLPWQFCFCPRVTCQISVPCLKPRGNQQSCQSLKYTL